MYKFKIYFIYSIFFYLNYRKLSLILLLLSFYFILTHINDIIEIKLKLIRGFIFSFKIRIFLNQKLFFNIFFLISVLGIFFSIYYIKFSFLINRFIIVKVLFILSIRMLLFNKRRVILFIGWDGLGVTSFVLIIFYLNIKRVNSGLVTIIINRIGDGIFIILIIYLIILGTINIKFVYYSKFLILFFIIIILTKRAQFPFSTWLPLAIAAPTPISALVHSSTLVAAGIYLFLDNYLIVCNQIFNLRILSLSVITFFISGSISFSEIDIKKIIALSTLNQLRLIFISLTLGLVFMSFFHLVSHAIFKSLLFFNGGVVIHYFFSSQDYRGYNFSRINNTPILIITVILSLLNLIGLVFSSGFFSKDLIIITINRLLKFRIFTFLFIFILNFTFFYCIRLLKIIFFTSRNNLKLIFFFEEKSIFLTFNILIFVLIFFRIIVFNCYLNFNIILNIIKFFIINFLIVILVLFGFYLNLIYFNLKILNRGNFLNKIITSLTLLKKTIKIFKYFYEIGINLNLILKYTNIIKKSIINKNYYYYSNLLIIMIIFFIILII